MKKLKAPFLAVILLFSVFLALAATPPPPPPPQATAKSAGTASTNACAICPGGSTPIPLPINQNIIFLAISGLALGAAVIYKNKIKKASV